MFYFKFGISNENEISLDISHSPEASKLIMDGALKDVNKELRKFAELLEQEKLKKEKTHEEMAEVANKEGK